MPDIATQLIEQIRDANDANTALSIRGRGSKSFYGRHAEGKSLELAQHSGIVSYHATELVLTARAGTSLAEIETALDDCNQMLPFDPPRYGGDGTLGGTLACNQSGPGRPWAGSVRDAVLGVQLINAKGEHLRFGGQVMKNVAGFDVTRLQAGAMGSLGVITEISFKVTPKPAHTQTLVCQLDTANDALSVMTHYRRHYSPISGACWYKGKLYLRFSGAHSAVDAACKLFSSEHTAVSTLDNAGEFWLSLRDHTLDFFTDSRCLWRFSVNPSTPHASLDDDCLLDWGGAQRWSYGAHNQQALREPQLTASGQASLFRGGDRSAEVFHPPSSASKEIHQRLKRSFDENRIFNPGRLYSWL